jgi:hypothetical protein
MQRTEQGEAQQAIRALRETVDRLRTNLRNLEGARRRGRTITDRFQDLDDEVRTKYVDHAIKVKAHKANQMQGMNCKKQSLSILPSGANIKLEG